MLLCELRRIHSLVKARLPMPEKTLAKMKVFEDSLSQLDRSRRQA